MAITRDQKKKMMDKIEKIANESSSVVFVNFNALKVSDSTELRRSLKKEGVSFSVVKKSIVKKVLEGKKIPGVMPELIGEIGLVYGADLISPARKVNEFSRAKKDIVGILGGIFEGRFMSKSEMTEVALIPPVDTLRGMFVNIINSPIQGLVMVLNEVSKKKALNG